MHNLSNTKLYSAKGKDIILKKADNNNKKNVI